MRRAELSPRRLLRTFVGIWQMLVAARHLAGDRRSYAQLVADTFIYRLLRIMNVGQGQSRQIRVSDGTTLTYRADRGDIRALAETWITRAYDVSIPIAPGGIILDLGANIGITAAFLASTYKPSAYIAVEPVAANAELVRLNLSSNGVPGTVIEAAVGPADGQASFLEAPDSTQGQIGAGGRPVRMITVDTALAGIDPTARVALVKMDIEGGEGELFGGDLGWLDRVDCLVAELHPDLCNVSGVLSGLAAAGFVEHRYESGEPAGEEYMAYFTRESVKPSEARSAQQVVSDPDGSQANRWLVN